MGDARLVGTWNTHLMLTQQPMKAEPTQFDASHVMIMKCWPTFDFTIYIYRPILRCSGMGNALMKRLLNYFYDTIGKLTTSISLGEVALHQCWANFSAHGPHLLSKFDIGSSSLCDSKNNSNLSIEMLAFVHFIILPTSKLQWERISKYATKPNLSLECRHYQNDMNSSIHIKSLVCAKRLRESRRRPELSCGK